MVKVLAISCSLSPNSHSAVMADRFVEAARQLRSSPELVDLRNVSLPFCDGDACYGDLNSQDLSRRISAADAVALAVPIYNYDVGGAARNLIALTGSAWKHKVVGLIGAAGGDSSYMSLMPLANSLMLDFRCVIVPRYVYASKKSFRDGALCDPSIEERLVRLARNLTQFAQALRPVLGDL